MSAARRRHDDENLSLMTDQERRDAEQGDVEASRQDVAATYRDDDADAATASAAAEAPHDAAQRPRQASSSSGPIASPPQPDVPPAAGHHSYAGGESRSSSDSSAATEHGLYAHHQQLAWTPPKWIPLPVARILCVIIRWIGGPPNPHPLRIRPLFPTIQRYPLRLVDRLLPRRRHRIIVVLLYYSAWLLAFVFVKRNGSATADIAGWGQPRTIACGASYWATGNGCSLDGADCRPFNNGGFAFRCPANCLSYVAINPRAVGDQEVAFRPLVVGGPPLGAGNDSQDAVAVQDDQPIYRGDSYICVAAIHAGVISNLNGGCGVVSLAGRRDSYAASRRNGVDSIAFDSYFPLSFSFVNDTVCSADDPRWSLLAISTVFTAVLSLLTASPALFFFPVFIATFWTVGAALDPPPHRDNAALFSVLIGRFLPAMFVAWVMFDKMGVARALRQLTGQIEKTVLWLGACWVGAMSNYTLDFIPIQRLNKQDLDRQPGAKAALAIIIIVVAAIAATQIFFFRQEARLVRYLGLYGLFLAAIIIALVLPAQHLRLHHYIIALLLLPGTSMQTRPSLLYQGLLVGLFVNGVARWGFDPVLQTAGALLDGGQQGTLLPTLAEPVVNIGRGGGATSNITFTWDPPPDNETYDGISVLVNDVERFRTYFGDAGEKGDFVWSRNQSLGLPEYFRFAYMSGSEAGDYTRAGTWAADGNWTEMAPGPS